MKLLKHGQAEFLRASGATAFRVFKEQNIQPDSGRSLRRADDFDLQFGHPHP